MRARGRGQFLVGRLAGLGLLVDCQVLPPQLQQRPRMSRVAYLGTGPLDAIRSWGEAFIERVRAHGYEDGRNLVLDWRSIEGKPEEPLGASTRALRLPWASELEFSVAVPWVPRDGICRIARPFDSGPTRSVGSTVDAASRRRSVLRFVMPLAEQDRR